LLSFGIEKKGKKRRRWKYFKNKGNRNVEELCGEDSDSSAEMISNKNWVKIYEKLSSKDPPLDKRLLKDRNKSFDH
jgi:hypothetical protein